MNREDVHKLLGGYATGTLTEEERKALFSAALEDQELFEVLADEDALREMLAEPVTRRRLIADLTEENPSFWEAAWAWLRRPPVLALAGTAAVVVGTFTAVWLRREAPVELAQVKRPAAVREEAAPRESESVVKPEPLARTEAFRSGGGGVATPPRLPVSKPEAKEKAVTLKDADALSARGRDEERQPVGELGRTEAAAKKVEGAIRSDAAPAAPAAPLRVVVLNSPSPPVPGPASQRQLEAAMATQFGQKLNQPPGYAVVDQREVDKYLADRKLTNQELDASAAAGVGRALKADAVVVSNFVQTQNAPEVQMQTAPAPPAGQSADSAILKQGQRMRKAQEQNQARSQVQSQAGNLMTAEVIDTRNEARRFKAAGNVDQVASQVSTQLAQIRNPRPWINVRSVSGATVVLEGGSRLGIGVGTRLDVLRQGRLLGEVTVTTVTEDTAEGTFTGPDVPRPGDQAHSK
ncbi:MAG: hypothetical protein ACKV22_08585 [Bryobacteraceae bacterium]